MKFILNPVALVCLLIVMVAIAFSNLPLAAVGGLGWAMTEAWLVMKGTQQRRAELVVGEDLKPESQALLRPIRRLAKDMHEFVERSSESSTVAAMGKDVLTEADRVVTQSAVSLTVRDELKRLLRGKYEAEKEIARVQESIRTATSDDERKALEATSAARQTEIAHYAEIETVVGKIDTDLRQAEAALAELKARLSVYASQGSLAETNSDQLRESLLRVRAVTLSVDEAEELING